MTRVKICGIKSREELAVINDYPLDYAGFIFAKSKRQVGVDQASDLVKQLQDPIQPVGVFVDEPVENILKISHHCGLKVIQLHGSESLEVVQVLKNEGVTVWKSLALKDQESVEMALAYEIALDGVLAESYDPGLKGGTGKNIPPGLAKAYFGTEKLTKGVDRILAGGLSPDNIVDKIRAYQPDIIDVNSKLEVNGLKIRKQVHRLFEKLKEV